MSQVSEQLRGLSKAFSNDADAYFKSIDWELTKQAALNSLVEGGVTQDAAVKILDELETRAVPDKAATLEKIAHLREQSEVFSATADYLENIESKLNDSKARVAELEKQASMKPVVSSLKEKAMFNDEDIEELNSLSEGLLSKVASLRIDESPAGLGKVSSRSSAGTDAMLEFLNS